MAILKDLLVNGNSSLLGTTTAVSILPQTDANYNLGSSDLNWNNIYGTLVKVTAYENTITIGSLNSSYAHIYSSSKPFVFNLDLLPLTSTRNIGVSEGLIWNNMYAKFYHTLTNGANTSGNSGFAIEDTTGQTYGNLYLVTLGTTGVEGTAGLTLGNSLAAGTAKNAKGYIYLYGSQSKYTTFKTSVTDNTNNNTFILPDYAGTSYLTHVSGTSKVGDTNLPVYVAANGRITATGYTFTTSAPTSSSDNTTIPTSAAVWSAVDDRLFSCSGMAPGKSSSDWYKIYEYPVASSGTYNYTIMFNDTYDTASGGPIQASNAIVLFYLNRDGSGSVTATARYLAQTHFSADRIAYHVDATDTNNKKFAIYVYNISTNQYTRVKATLLRFLTRDGESSYNLAQYFLSSNNIVDALPEGAKYPVSTIPTLEDGVLLNDNTNLNSIYDYGSYYINASAKAKLFTNNPYNDNQTLSAFTLNVMCGIGRTESSQNYRKQDLREFGRPTHFTRNTSNSSSWGNWAAYAYNPNTASTVGSSSSPIYVDKTGELKACTSINCGEITTPKIYIYGNQTSNKTNRFISSDALSNMYFSVDSLTVLVLLKGDTNTVRRGAAANATDLGTSTYPWNNIYGNKLIVGAITVGDSTDSTTGRTITSSSTLYLNRASGTSIVFLQAGVNYISIDASNNLAPFTTYTELLNLGLSNKKWKAVYAKDFYGSGSNLTDIYVGSVAKTSTATYNTTPEVASIKVGNGTAAAAGANGCTMQYDSTLQTLKFVFA